MSSVNNGESEVSPDTSGDWIDLNGYDIDFVEKDMVIDDEGEEFGEELPGEDRTDLEDAVEDEIDVNNGELELVSI